MIGGLTGGGGGAAGGDGGAAIGAGGGEGGAAIGAGGGAATGVGDAGDGVPAVVAVPLELSPAAPEMTAGGVTGTNGALALIAPAVDASARADFPAAEPDGSGMIAAVAPIA